MSWTLSALRVVPFVFSSIFTSIFLIAPAVAQQSDPAENTEIAPSEDPSEAELKAYYDERLKTAPAKVKELLGRIEASRLPANLTFRMGYTTALDRTLAELTGAKPGPSPDVLKAQMQRANATMARYRQLRGAERLPEPGAACNPAAKTFSWRKFNKVTPIRDQGDCGSCWAFSAAASYESSYVLLNNKGADVSEQDLLDCTPEANCIGNLVENAFDHMVVEGATTESGRPYRGQQEQCSADLRRPYRAVVWAPLDQDWSRVMSPDEIKTNLCAYGPLVAHIYATPSFLAYTSGVYTEVEPVTYESEGYHAIVITGWDDKNQAWEIKNSWSTGWGMRGFAKVRYGANLIGHHLLAVVAMQESLGREAMESLRQAASKAVPEAGEMQSSPPASGN
jgi:cathepsin L